MDTAEFLPLAAIAYPPEHPYPVAVRQLSQLQTLVLSGAIVQVDQLTRYSASPNGGMTLAPGWGPWVPLLDLTGHAKPVHSDDVAVGMFSIKMRTRMTKARKEGRAGWDDERECSIMTLARLLTRAAMDGDLVSVANYCMMLDSRNADSTALGDAIITYTADEHRSAATMVLGGFSKYLAGYRPGDDAWTLNDDAAYRAALSHAPVTTPPVKPPAELAHEAADTFAQALIAQGWHNDNPNCVDGLQVLLKAYMETHKTTEGF